LGCDAWDTYTDDINQQCMQNFDGGNLFEASHLEYKWGMEDYHIMCVKGTGFGDIAASIDILLCLNC
jgi:hypothetical protein